MMPFRNRDRTVFIFSSALIALALACSDSASPGIHGATSLVVGPPVDIEIAPTSAALIQGGRALLRCAAFDARGVMVSSDRTWTSSDPSVVTVASDGSLTAQRPGGALVTCQIGGRSATSAITVSNAQIAFVEVTPGAGTVTKGASLPLSGVPRDSFGIPVPGATVQWSSADPTIAAVDAAGVVSAKADGDADIWALSGGVAGLTKIKVTSVAPPPVASITISIDATSLNAGQMAHASATTADATGQTLSGRSIKWSASNPAILSVVTVNAVKANVRGLAQGISTLTATSEGQSASVSVTVGPPIVASIATSLASPTIQVGHGTLASAVPLDGMGNPMTGQVVTWTSLDPDIATVSSTGVVTGVAPGSVIIRATSSGVTGDATLTVVPVPVAVVTATLAASTLTTGQTTQATAVALDAAGNTLSGRSVAWSSLSPNIATVSIAGVVTAVAPGSAVVRATIESKTGDAPVTINASTATNPTNPTSPSPSPSTNPPITPIPATGTTVVVSDTSTYVNGHASAYASPVSPSWSASIPGAKWLWKTPLVADPTVTDTGTFTRLISLSALPMGTTLDLAADDEARVLVNGHLIVDNLSSVNPMYQVAAHYVIPVSDLVVGTDTITILVRNNPSSSTNPLTNPAGLLYALTVSYTTATPAPAAPPPATLPPPGTGTGAHPNEPVGFSQLRVQPFDSVENQDYYPAAAGNPTIVGDSTSPGSSQRVAQMFFPAGFGSGSAPGSEWSKKPFSNQSIYVSFFIKVSSNWYGNGAGMNKILYWQMLNGGYQASGGSIELFGIGTGDLRPGLVPEGITGFIQGPDNPTGAPPSVRLDGNRSSAVFTRGVWHHYEVLFVNNTPGNTDGTIKWWLDGSLYGDYTNRIQFQNLGLVLNDLVWSPTYGGGGPPVPYDMFMYLKDLYVSAM